jgi:Arc/MetJ-type ribon-helix-helix transcriptional regulator
MAKLPNTENTEVLTIRISPKLKEKLNQLAKRGKYGDSASSTVRALIESAYKR